METTKTIENNDKKKSPLQIANTVISVILWIFLVFSALVCVIALTANANDDNVPHLFGYSFLSVITDSMDCEGGDMKEGDLILVRLLDEEGMDALENGNIISFFDDTIPTEDGKPQINTHRIKDIERDGAGHFFSATTKGDNPLATVDKTHRYKNDIVGVYVKNLGGLGNAYSYLRSSDGFLVCIEIPLILFFIYEVFIVVKNIVELRNRDKKIITEEDEELIRREAVAEYLRQQEEKNKAEAKAAETAGQTSPDGGEAPADKTDEAK